MRGRNGARRNASPPGAAPKERPRQHEICSFFSFFSSLFSLSSSLPHPRALAKKERLLFLLTTTKKMFSSSLPASSASTTRVLSNGTLSQGLWLDRSALAYDVLVGNVRFGKQNESSESTHSEALDGVSHVAFGRHPSLCLCRVL